MPDTGMEGTVGDRAEGLCSIAPLSGCWTEALLLLASMPISQSEPVVNPFCTPSSKSDSSCRINLLNASDFFIYFIGFFLISRHFLLSLVLTEASSITKKPLGQWQMASIALQPVRSTCLPESTRRRDGVTRGADGARPLPSPHACSSLGRLVPLSSDGAFPTLALCFLL